MEPTNPTPPPAQNQTPPQSKSKAGKWLILAGVVVLFLAAAVLIRHLTSEHTTTPSQKAAQAAVATVEITADGFSPSTLSVPVGTKVTWVNKDSQPHRVASNPYPENTSLPSLDSKDPPLGPNATYTYTFTTAGNVSYHDQYHPTTNGQVTVK
jgi:plastocyanin